MAHLGAEVAGFVDGQLTDERRIAAELHLASCARCRTAVNEQRRLKERMSGARLPAPPSDLHNVLTGIAHEPHRRRLVLPRIALAGAALMGVSAFVLGAAYLLGDTTTDGDPVAPGYAGLLAAFTPTPAVPTPSRTVRVADTPESTSAPTAAELEAHGWPCPEHLVGLDREDVAVNAEAVSVLYGDGSHRLQLHEQAGRLDVTALAGADTMELAGTRVWVAETDPAVLTWQAPGMVLTVITDLSSDQWDELLAELPALPIPGTAERFGRGLDRMADWMP